MNLSWIVVIWLFAHGVTTCAAPPSFPWHAGGMAPIVAAVHLGDSRERLDELLGKPSETQKMGEDGFGFVYTSRGITVAWTPLDGVAIIFLNTRTAGDIGGVRIGDTVEEVLARWGAPSTVGHETAIYKAGSWGVVLKLDATDHVSQLYLGRLDH